MKLKDFCDISSGGTPSRSNNEYWDNGNIPWLKISDLKNKYIDKCDEYITEKALNNSSAKLYSKGTILYTIFATIGEVAILDFDATTNQAIAGLKINDESLQTEYLYYYLKSLKQKMKNESRGVAQNNINLSILRELDISVPSIDKQNIIIDALSKLDDLIETKKSQIVSCNNLIKSQFVEMFGDFYDDSLWETVNISKILKDKPSNGFFTKRNDYNSNGNVSVLGVASVVNRMYSNVENLPRTNASDKDIEKFKVKYGDLLFCRSSLVQEGIGKASIVPEDVDDIILFECHVIRFILDMNKCVPEYIQMFTTTNYFRNQILSGAKTSTMTTIGQSDILKCDIKLPSIEKQLEFKNIVKQIDKQKFEFEKSLKKLEELQASLMQEYFG